MSEHSRHSDTREQLNYLDDAALTIRSEDLYPTIIRVLLADPYQLFRQALKQYLDQLPDIRVVAEAGSPSDYRKVAESIQHDVVIMASDLLAGTHSTASLRVNEHHLGGAEDTGTGRQRKPTVVLVTDEDQDSVPGLATADRGPLERHYVYRGAPIEAMVDAVRTLCRLANAGKL